MINLYNEFHLGDNVFSMILFYNLKNYIESNNIIINYYCHKEHHRQLKEYIISSNVILHDFDKIGINIWIGNREFEYNIYNKDYHTCLNDFYVKFFNNLLKKLNIDYHLNSLEYKDNDLITRYDKLNDKYKDIDILIINSDTVSGQYHKNEYEWEKIIDILNSKYNIVITKKINDKYKCTTDDNLTIKDIASISTKVKIVLSINTGVFPGLLNNITLNNVKRIYNFDLNNGYSFSKFINCRGCISNEINIEEIDNIMSNKVVNKIINTFNNFHLGDNLFSMILFNNITNYIENNNIIIHHHCPSEYHNQLNEYIISCNVVLYEKEDKGTNIWIGNGGLSYNYFNRGDISYNLFYVNFYNNLLNVLNINYSIDKLEYKDNELITRYNKLDDKYKNVDILIVNSSALSGQYHKEDDEWEKFTDILNSKYNVVITQKINDKYKCTADDNLTIKDIAAISTKVKIIVAINTGVFPSLLNNITLNNVKKIYVFDNCVYYKMDKVQTIRGSIITELDINEIYEICSTG